MRFRPLAAAIAVAGMLASGCDYWRNLVDDRTVATARLKVKVFDALTLEPLVAACTDTSHGLVLDILDPEGQADILTGTGMYTIHCNVPWGYYERTKSFPLTASGETVTFSMARRGGEGEWYTDDTLREVRIREKFDVLRFPSELVFNAYPEDTHSKQSRFRYVWTFSQAQGLDQDSTSTNGKYPSLRKRAETGNADPGPDTLTLRVWSYLNDSKAPYYIGMDKRPFVWARNQLPILSMSEIPNALHLVGCPQSQPFRITFSAADPDGTCKTVRFYTVDTGSSFGAVNTTLTCAVARPQFPLVNTFEPLRSDSAWMRDNEMKITVTDDNGGRFDTSIVVRTRTNILPTITSLIDGSGAANGTRTYAFIGDSIKVRYESSDSDGTPKSVLIDWGGAEGQTLKNYRQGLGNTLKDSAIWSYQTPGWKYINVSVKDECNAMVNSMTDSILIRTNRAPKVELQYLQDEVTAQDQIHVFRLFVTDEDISQDLDDMITEVYVNWGESPAFQDAPNIRSRYIKRLEHHFTKPPDSLGRYRILIYAHDAHNGVGTLDTLFLVP